MTLVSSTDLNSNDDDDFYFALLALFAQNPEEDDEISHVQDDRYIEELQLQEALMSTTHMKNPDSISSSTVPQPQPRPKDFTHETGQSSQSFCEICLERKEPNEMFTVGGCAHSFCTECISMHVKTRLEEGVTVIKCPAVSCRAVLELDACRPVLPKGVLDLWEKTLCVKLIEEKDRLYCPFRDCSAVLLNDTGGEVIMESECPFCHRLFCAQCKVPWHQGMDCKEFQRLNEDERGREDLTLRSLAKEKKWGRCPRCKYYVERTEGCPHITCRCGFQFCYLCGAEWTEDHGGCQGE
ncbi:hypothetical protein SLEP1_g21124 [Rubroshorea leprosula]|uniref:RBR-type E3 ubiquitin transferase n=1 Tax=Rubroshorea leprosula TaxID=152421 RepID=A0AAV5JDQ1_9ROSI|nr:hypothetical protein SLEP1_g21124 [Rubroshorea leprosula]